MKMYIVGCEALSNYFEENNIPLSGYLPNSGYYFDGHWRCELVEVLKEMNYVELKIV